MIGMEVGIEIEKRWRIEDRGWRYDVQVLCSA
jgi:hypothetical protein